MFNWEDIEYINPRKKVFKNMNTNEMINLELQEDPDNILKESKTPLTAYNLNQAQQEVVDDMSKTYIGTNITAPTIEGYGRINKLYGKTEEIGAGEKSPDNPYELKCVGDDVNLFDEKWRQGAYSNNTMLTRVFSASDIKVEKGSYTVITNLDFSKYNISFAASDTPYPAPGPLLADSGWQTKNEITIEIFQDGYLGIGVKKQDESNITPDEMKKYEFRIQNKLKKIETISKNGTNTSSNITYTNSPLCYLKDEQNNIIAQDYIDYTNKKVHRECGYIVFDGSEDEDWEFDANYNRFYINKPTNYKVSIPEKQTSNCNKYKIGNTEIVDSSYIVGNSGFIVKDSRFNTVNAFKDELKQKKLIFITSLITPVEEDIECSNKIVQYDEETTVYNRDGAEIEVSLTNNKAISEVNEDLNNIEKSTNNIEEMRQIKVISKEEFFSDINVNIVEFYAYKQNNIVNIQRMVVDSTSYTASVNKKIGTIKNKYIPASSKSIRLLASSGGPAIDFVSFIDPDGSIVVVSSSTKTSAIYIFNTAYISK